MNERPKIRFNKKKVFIFNENEGRGPRHEETLPILEVQERVISETVFLYPSANLLRSHIKYSAFKVEQV